jgi:hypothetical protein
MNITTTGTAGIIAPRQWSMARHTIVPPPVIYGPGIGFSIRLASPQSEMATAGIATGRLAGITPSRRPRLLKRRNRYEIDSGNHPGDPLVRHGFGYYR